MAWTNIIIKFFWALFSNSETFNVVSKFRISLRATRCSNLCLNCKTVWSARRVIYDFDLRIMRFSYVLSTFGIIMAWTNIIVEFFWALFSNCKTSNIVSKFNR